MQSPTLARIVSGCVRLGFLRMSALPTRASAFLSPYIRPSGSLSPQPLSGMTVSKAERS